jgi:hypothetical protein
MREQQMTPIIERRDIFRGLHATHRLKPAYGLTICNMNISA